MDQQTKVNEMLPSQGNMINELFAQNYAASLRTAYAILRSKEDAEDAVQTAYRAAFRGFSKFRGELSFKTWITRITVNCCLIQLREHRARPLVALDNLLRPLEFNHTPPHPRCSAICGNFRWHTRGQHQDCRNPSTMSMSIP
jgi:DNA-directed RNA polymerase specialized sigma24 family protein